MLEVFFLVVEEVVFEAVAVVSFSVVVLSVSLSEEMSLSEEFEFSLSEHPAKKQTAIITDTITANIFFIAGNFLSALMPEG